jgi:GABA permease
MWFFPYLTWAVIGVIVAVLVAMAVTPALRSQFYSSGASVLLVLGAFLLRRRHGGALSGAKQGSAAF